MASSNNYLYIGIAYVLISLCSLIAIVYFDILESDAWKNCINCGFFEKLMSGITGENKVKILIEVLLHASLSFLYFQMYFDYKDSKKVKDEKKKN